VDIDGNVTNRTNTQQIHNKYEHYLSEDNLLTIDKDAVFYAEHWLEIIPYDKNISKFASFIAYNLKENLVLVLKHIWLINKINPTEIVIHHENDLIYDTVNLFTQEKSIRLITLGKNESDGNRNDKQSTLKKESYFKIVIKVLCEHLLSIANNFIFYFKNKTNHSNILLCPYLHTKQLLLQLLQNNNCNVTIFGFNYNLFKKHFGKIQILYYRHARIDKQQIQDENIFANPLKFNTKLLYNGINIELLLQVALSLKLKQYGLQLCAFYYRYFQKIKRMHLDLIISNQDVANEEKVLIRIGNDLNIKTMVVQHGAVFTPAFLIRPIANMFLFWDIATREYYIRNYRLDSSKTILVKSDYLLSLRNLKGSNYKNAKNYRQPRKNDIIKILFFAPAWSNHWACYSPHEPNEILWDVCSIIASEPQAQCIVRFHPSTQIIEGTQIKNEILSSVGKGRCFIDKNIELIDSIVQSDFIIGVDSTAVYEAMFAGKTTIVYNPTGKDLCGCLAKTNAVKYCINKIDLHAAVKEFICESNKDIYNKNISNFIKANFVSTPSMYDVVTSVLGLSESVK